MLTIAAVTAVAENLGASSRPHLHSLIDFRADSCTACCGGRVVMREQLAYLLEITQHPQVTIQVVPYSSQGLPGLLGGFILAERAGTPQTVYVESQPNGSTNDDRALIARIVRRYDAIRAEAYPQHLSLNMIKDVIDHG